MFKTGDKIQIKNTDETREVLAVFEHPTRHQTWLTLFTNTEALIHAPADLYELAPDPMVARREAVSAYCKARGWTYHQMQALEGDGDAFVDEIYDAIVATKHLFT